MSPRLDAWATLNKVPVSFHELLSSDGRQDDPNCLYVSQEILTSTIASNLVLEDMDPDDARVQLRAAHDNGWKVSGTCAVVGACRCE
jgi:hypothetical protein